MLEWGLPVGKKDEIIESPLHLNGLSERDYIRGLYDGDGSLGMDKNNKPYVSIVSNSDKIIGYINNYLYDNKIINIKKSISRNKRDNIYNYMINIENAVKFCEHIYYQDCLSISRKYEKAKEILNWVRPKNMIKIENRKNWDKYSDNYILNNHILDSMKHLDRTEKSIKMRLYRLKRK